MAVTELVLWWHINITLFSPGVGKFLFGSFPSDYSIVKTMHVTVILPSDCFSSGVNMSLQIWPPSSYVAVRYPSCLGTAYTQFAF